MNRHPRRVIALTVVGILMAGLAAGGGWWLGQRGDRQPAASGVTTAPPITQPAPTTAPATPTSRERVGTWQRLPATPIPNGSYEFSGVWTGRELLLYGAVHDPEQRPRAAGAAYNPATNTWRKLPPAPGPVENAEGGYTAVWTGTELLGGGLGLNAAYNPATNRWRRLPRWGDRNAVTVWTGRLLLTWGGGCCDDFVAGGGAYNPATNTWRQLPQGPLAGRHTTGAWTGAELIVAGGTGSDAHGNVAGYKTFADAAAYNPTTDTWRRLPPMPEPRTNATATWTGTEVLVVGGRDTGRHYADGVAYNPATNRWRRLPAMESNRIGHTATWTGNQLLIWGGQTRRAGSWTAPAHGLAYDPASNRWSPLPESPLRGRTGHVAVWTGTQMLIWGGGPARESDTQRHFNDGAAYTPYPM